jgi:4-hydroxybenzoate polyprenyltransferase
VTFIVPNTCFGIFGALAGPLLTTSDNPSVKFTLFRVLFVVFYNWSNVLVFELANQRGPDSVLEDSINKPNRPIPSGRVTALKASRLLLCSLPTFLAFNWLLGVWRETALLFILTWMYNDLHGGEENFVIRNFIIATAFGLYNYGSLQVTIGPLASITSLGTAWVILISCVIFTTMQIQDLCDQAGDKAKGRSTAPLMMGDKPARWTVAIAIAIWSQVCPVFLGLGVLGHILPSALGVDIIRRLFMLKDAAADRKSWELWAGWMAILYFLPVLQQGPVSFSRVLFPSAISALV